MRNQFTAGRDSLNEPVAKLDDIGRIVLLVLMAPCRNILRHISLDTLSSAWPGVRFQASC